MDTQPVPPPITTAFNRFIYTYHARFWAKSIKQTRTIKRTITMTHATDTSFITGKPSFTTMGKILETAPQTSREAIIEAGLDWQVEKRPIFTKQSITVNDLEFTTNLEVPNNYAIIRSRNINGVKVEDALSVVGKKYQPLNNINAFGFIDKIIQNSEATFYSAGSLNGGRIIWISVKLNGTLRIQRGDEVAKYLLLSSSHDGSSSVSVMITPVRLLCANQLTIAKQSANPNHFLAMRHTSSLLQKMDSTATYMRGVSESFEHSANAYRFISGKPINATQIDEYLLTLFPDPKEDAKRNRNKSTREKIVNLFETGRGTDVISDSYWKIYNSIVEYLDFERNKSNDDSRIRSSLWGSGRILKEAALKLALEA
jgi:phage/plasmid-like protein (TIGR03299 family)